MKFKPGDRVKFLNEKGGGVVRRLLDANTIEVTIEDGFDLPFKISEIIPDPQYMKVEEKDERQDSVLHPESEQETGREGLLSSASLSTGVYFALRPQIPERPSGVSDVLLVNNSGTEIIYNVYTWDKGRFRGAHYGNMEQGKIVILDSVDFQGAEKWCRALFQLMFHEDLSQNPPEPVTAGLKIKHSRLMHEETYGPNDFFDQPALIRRLFPFAQESEQPPVLVKREESLSQSLIEQHRVADGEAEVDLHFDKLPSWNPDTPADQIMRIQLDYLRRTLESAISAGYRKLVYVHGVGAGVLKIEIRKVLETYDFIEFYDASISKYGIGATELRIYQTKK